MKDLIEKLGSQLLKEAMAAPQKDKPAMDTKSKVDIFKAASLWYVANRKTRKGEADPDAMTGETFDQIAKRLNGKGATPQ
jgi:hypothetical protein